MGKASRRKGKENKRPLDPSQMPAPFVARPFEGLAGETDWVAMREIVPSATAKVTFEVDGQEHEAVIATILPMAWPGLRREDGDMMVALQTGGGSGDASRDLAAQLIAVTQLENGQPLPAPPRVSAATPRLQDIITSTTFEPTVHETFDFWIPEEHEIGEEASVSMEDANESIAPTAPIDGIDSAYWCLIGDRAFIRWVLPHDENKATDALARLSASGKARMPENDDEGRLLGAFRACGVLTPVWEVATDRLPEQQAAPMAELAKAFDDAFASLETEPLTADERRARNGVVSRQITLR